MTEEAEATASQHVLRNDLNTEDYEIRNHVDIFMWFPFPCD